MHALMATPDRPDSEPALHGEAQADVHKLAAAEAELKRELNGNLFERVQETGCELRRVDATFAFKQDDYGHAEANVQVESEGHFACQWCLEKLPITLTFEFSCRLAADEAQANVWSEVQPEPVVVVLPDRRFDPVMLLEDEILLQIPNRVCQLETCERRPPKDYGEVVEEAPAEHPFDGLKALLQDNKGTEQ